MKRRVMQILFALGLLLTVAAGTLWVRAFGLSDVMFVGRAWSDGVSYGSTDVSLSTSARRFMVVWRRDWRDAPWSVANTDIATPRFHAGHYQWQPNPFRVMAVRAPDPLWVRLGFEHDYKEFVAGPIGLKQRVVSVPSWLALVACAAPTAAIGRYLWRARQLRFRRQCGLCPTCGYDLRGVAHERCPECGANVE